VEKLSAAFKKLNMIKAQKLEITRIQDGPTMQKVTFRLKGLTFSDLEKQVKNLKAELGVDSLAVENGEEAGTAALLFKHDTPKPVFLRDLLNSQEFQAFKNTVDLPVVIGVDTIGNPILDSLERLRHLLVAGTTGSGKSVYINAFLLTLLLLKKPSEIAVFCIDPKRVELAHFRQFPQVKEVITDMDKANDLLKKIVSEMERRYELMEKAGVKTMQAYNEISSHKLHYIIVVIDEYADLVMEHPDVELAVRRLGQMARAAGIHLVIATQRPDSEIVTSKIKTNIRSRICFACASRHDYGTVLDRAVNFDLAGRGDGLCTREGVSGLTRFQGAMIAQSEKEEKEIFAAAAMKWVNQEQTINPELEKLKQIVAETKEVRIKELQKRMGMRTAKVQELMVLLVEEGWLEAPQEEYQSYRILLSDEELQKYIQGQSS
jgi:S-DNA-T family DNA segregation ATPase FtsK/SpoIIIE